MDPTTQTIQAYDSSAEEYKKRYLNSGDTNIMKPLLDKLIAYLKPNASVLDIGSGAGFDARYLSDQELDVTSIDLSEKLIELAQEVAPKAKFIKMDMRNITLEDNSFDGIWASASLLHITKAEFAEVLKKTYSILKPNGTFFVALKEGEGEKFVTNQGENNLDGVKRFFAYYSKEELETLLAQAGFSIIESSTNTNRENTWLNFFCRK